MFFRSYPFSYLRDARSPAILALHADNFIGEVRIKPFLNALLARGVNADYQVVDRSMAMAGPLKSYAFTHIWCQRSVSTAQFRFLKRHAHVPIIYDIDDLITSIPDFVMRVRHRTRARIDWFEGDVVARLDERQRRRCGRGESVGQQMQELAQVLAPRAAKT